MKNSIRTNLFFLVLAAAITFVLYSCKEDTVTPPPAAPEANTISGKVTFRDTNNLTSGGYYFIAAYSTWFPSGPPSAGDTIQPTKVGNTYEATYKLRDLSDGNYVVTTAWIKLPYGPGSVYGLGLYGCDTPSCVGNPPRVTISNNQGVENANFNSWLDTANAYYRF